MPDMRVTDALHLAYNNLRIAWQSTLQDRREGANAPSVGRLIGIGDTAIPDKNVLLQSAHFMAVDASKSVLHHLRCLAKMYRADGDPGEDLDADEWPGMGAYSVARAMLEGAAMTSWLMAPHIGQDERVLRASLIGLWSAREDRRPPPTDPDVWALKDWKKAVESCGLEVHEADYKLGVRLGGKVKYFRQTDMIRETLGQPGSTLYREWSGVAHHAAWAVGDQSVYEITADGGGAHSYTKRGDKKHLGMAADVAEVLAQAGEAMAGYWARDCDDLLEVCAQNAAFVREGASQLPDD